MNRSRYRLLVMVLSIALIGSVVSCTVSPASEQLPISGASSQTDSSPQPAARMFTATTPVPDQVGSTEEVLIGCDPVTGRAQEVNLCWEQLCVATGYDVEVAKDEEFTTKVIDWVPTCDFNSNDFYKPEMVTAPCAYIPAGGTITSSLNPGSALAITLNGSLECGHTYYWRVQARLSATGEIARSPWSNVKSFTIKAGLPVSTPYYGPQLLSPNNGCLGCPAKLVFLLLVAI